MAKKTNVVDLAMRRAATKRRRARCLTILLDDEAPCFKWHTYERRDENGKETWVVYGWRERPGGQQLRAQDQTQNIVGRFASPDEAKSAYPLAAHVTRGKLFTCIGLETSMRKIKILRMRREHVHVDRRRVYIPSAKSGAREQPITGRLAEQLRAHITSLPKGSEWLFPSNRAKAGHSRDVKDAFRRAVKAAGLDPARVVRHTLRHTAISHLVQAGVDLPTVQRISGHKTLAMVARYAHANGAHVQAAMSALEQRYSATQDEAAPTSERETITPVRRTGTFG